MLEFGRAMAVQRVLADAVNQPEFGFSKARICGCRATCFAFDSRSLALL